MQDGNVSVDAFDRNLIFLFPLDIIPAHVSALGHNCMIHSLLGHRISASMSKKLQKSNKRQKAISIAYLNNGKVNTLYEIRNINYPMTIRKKISWSCN